eukprot:gnl/TRDRNA2_/TRDRNA2_168023_c0_seq7.p1 gnl/TRDRNA2_/TRDRNA2_168023_c0~~gnl/TRDRNA2_/TRDRNA2_168023_c0_seq7.p1  ORF type:complete len:546 (-),score=75.09 gnl/TRDRNA2_/TRDRNA2_168023_c0_seq7:132-1769(-)
MRLIQLAAITTIERWFVQKVDHFSDFDATFDQRYYQNNTYFAGPGSPMIFILGGEGGIPPSTGIYYPWVVDVLGKSYDAAVLEPEHRYYGKSLPFGSESFNLGNLQFLTTAQALEDYAVFIRSMQAAYNCTGRGTPGYCPVLTIGGSYPGFLSAMMRLLYPTLVDMALASSAPMKFYSQEVGQYEYYQKITESAEKTKTGCANAVRTALEEMQTFMAQASIAQIVQRFSICTPLPPSSSSSRESLADDLLFLAEQTFANLNMANYPPGPDTGLSIACGYFVESVENGGDGPLDAVRTLLLMQTQNPGYYWSGKVLTGDPYFDEVRAGLCFEVADQLPSGPSSSARCGDWSGCGKGHDGAMWDYQTCSYQVEWIGFDNSTQMFPSRPFTLQWLQEHCRERFNIDPEPDALLHQWKLDDNDFVQQASRIIFTNGLNDGWSVGGYTDDNIFPEENKVLCINMPNGAHHSELCHVEPGENDTPDVISAKERIHATIGQWLQEIHPATYGDDKEEQECDEPAEVADSGIQATVGGTLQEGIDAAEGSESP